MTTRRNVHGEQLQTSESHPTPAHPAQHSSISPAVPTSVILKLLTFTFAMVLAPISMYFLTLHRVFGGNSTWAGATAAATANAVLIGYIVVAVREDQSDRLEEEAIKMAGRGRKGE